MFISFLDVLKEQRSPSAENWQQAAGQGVRTQPYADLQWF